MSVLAPAAPRAAEPARALPSRELRGPTLVICLLSNVFTGMLATLMATYLPDSVRDLTGASDAATVGRVGAYVGSLFLLGWAAGGVGFGWAADRFGRARAFTASLLLFSLATLAASQSPTWPVLVACRLLTGVGIGGTMVTSAIVLAEAYRERARAVVLGVLGVAYPIGIISTGAVTYSGAGWRTGFLTGVLPLVLGLVAAAVVRDSKQWREGRRHRDAGPSAFRTLLGPAHRRDFLLGAAVFGSMSIGLWATFSWLPAWAQDLIGPAGTGGGQQRGMLMMVLGTGGIVGGALSGFLANALGRRPTLVLSYSGSFVASGVLLLTNRAFTPLVLAETALLAVFFGISQGTLTVYITELFPTAVRATATGVCFNVGRLATACAVFFVGMLVPLLGGYGNAVSVFSVMYLLGLVALWMSRDTRPAPAPAPA